MEWQFEMRSIKVSRSENQPVRAETRHCPENLYYRHKSTVSATDIPLCQAQTTEYTSYDRLSRAAMGKCPLGANTMNNLNVTKWHSTFGFSNSSDCSAMMKIAIINIIHLWQKKTKLLPAIIATDLVHG